MSSTILIGVVDDAALDSSASPSFMDNRIGGKPLFSPHLNPSTLNIECNSCSVDCTFLMQIYCPVDQSAFDRVLYLFLCTNSACTKREIQSYRTLTKPALSMECESAEEAVKKSEKLFDDEWAEEDDDWGTESPDKEEEAMKLSDKLSTLDISSAHFSGPQKHFRELFQQRYISVFEEPDKNDTKSVNSETNDLSKLMAEDGGDSACVGEEYEKSYSAAFGKNRTNYQFYKRISRCSSQIVRYDWGGEPLLFNDTCLQTSVKNCDLCNSSRIFELQLTPALVSILSQLKVDRFAFEFETVYVFSCSKNCSNKSETPGFYREVAICYCEDYSKDQYCQFEGVSK